MAQGKRGMVLLAFLAVVVFLFAIPNGSCQMKQASADHGDGYNGAVNARVATLEGRLSTLQRGLGSPGQVLSSRALPGEVHTDINDPLLLTSLDRVVTLLESMVNRVEAQAKLKPEAPPAASRRQEASRGDEPAMEKVVDDVFNSEDEENPVRLSLLPAGDARRHAAKAEAELTVIAAAAAGRALQAAEKRPFAPLGRVGVILNAYGDQKYVEDALEVVRNLRTTVPRIDEFTLWANERNKKFLERRMKDAGDVVLKFYEDVTIPVSVSQCDGFQAPPRMFLAKVVSATLSPYDTTLLMDNDVTICSDIAHLFPSEEFNYDVGSAVAPFARWGGVKQQPYFNVSLHHTTPATRRAFGKYIERNVGFMILRTSEPAVKGLLQDWLKIYTTHIGSQETCKNFHHEQPAFREALFRRQHLPMSDEDFVSERLFPLDRVCRSGNAIIGCQLKK
eukprot:gene17340-26638_t